MTVNDDATRQICEGTWRKTQLIAWAMLTAPVLYVVIGLILANRSADGLPLGKTLDAATASALFYAFLAVAATCFVVPIGLRRWLLSPTFVRKRCSSVSAAAGQFLQTTVVTFAMCETPAVFGLLYFLLTGDVGRMVLLAGIAVVSSVVVFPTRSRLDATVAAIGGEEGGQPW
jgi:hypothetical protein